MQPIAAYYVLVANDLAPEPGRREYQVVPVRPNLTARIAAALARRVRTVRPTTTQPA